jgi:hypothetical protein
MSTSSDENSVAATINIEEQYIHISRYFTTAGLVVLLYDTMLTMGDEVSELLTRTLDSRSLSPDPPGLARTFQISEAPVLHQPVLDDCVLSNHELLSVPSLREDV